MSQDIINENQAISYTNLDFSSIYTETLDLVKQLTYKWDPSISDESDPGVVLVKLGALLADKCNYNIDKSVLEAFPLSVTQESNARQMYEQLGYYMDWYESASVPLYLNWSGDKAASSDTVALYTIPKFTIVTDLESANNYAIVGVYGTDDIVVSDVTISTDASQVGCVAMEGTPTKFSFLGETTITAQMVDENNRLYFESAYVSQNGVFIKNVDQENYAQWRRVNNLYEQSYDELRYKFGYDSSSNLCYIEFPDNYQELFGNGIEIVYLIISPDYSDIPAQTLNNFLVSVTPKEDTSIALTSNNVKIINYSSASGHKDKEGIEEAYTNYKKTVGTFKTLITLRDYLNFIKSKDVDLCSNAFVCDRTNDVQLSYKVMNKYKGLNSLKLDVEREKTDYTKLVATEDAVPLEGKQYYYYDSVILTPSVDSTFIESHKPYYELDVDTSYEDRLSPFSLKFYMLQKAVSLNKTVAYYETFNLMKDAIDLDTALEDYAHLEHTYEDILPIGENTFKSSAGTSFDLNKTYFTVYDESIDYNKETFLSNGVKYVYVTDPESSSIENYYEIDHEMVSPHICMFKNKYPIDANISTYSTVSAKEQTEILQNVYTALRNYTSSSQIEFGERISIDYLTEIIENADSRIKQVKINDIVYTTEAIYYDSVANMFRSIEISNSMEEMGNSSSSLWLRDIINKDIVAKSILLGTTQLFVEDTAFKYTYAQEYKNYIEDVVNISSEVTINMADSTSVQSTMNGTSYIKKNYELRDNETLTLFRPQLIDEVSYTSGYHYEYILSANIAPNQSYKLVKNEFFILYAPNTDDNDVVTSYEATIYSEGAIIKPSFAITNNVYGTTELKQSLSYLSACGQSLTQLFNNTTDYVKSTTISSSIYITEIKNNANIIQNSISSINTIKFQKLNTITITKDDNYKFYWVLNKYETTYSNGKNIKQYKLFDKYRSVADTSGGPDVDNYDSINTYTLKAGEYLMYMNSEGSGFSILPAGTMIIRNCGLTYNSDSKQEYDFDFVEYNDIIENPTYVFQWIKNAYGEVDPHANGMYEEDTSTSYKRTSDTSLSSDKKYYVLLMKDSSGLIKWIQSEYQGDYNEASVDKTPTNFSEIDLHKLTTSTSSTMKDVNPLANNLYEQVSENGVALEDYYHQSEILDNTKYGEYDTFNRYTLSEDTSILTQKLIDDINITDITTYDDVEVLEGDTKANPSAQHWVRAVSTQSFIDYYETAFITESYSGSGDIQASHTPIIATSIDLYDSDGDTISVEGASTANDTGVITPSLISGKTLSDIATFSYYYAVSTSPIEGVTIDDEPYRNRWAIKDASAYKFTTDVYPTIVYNSDSEYKIVKDEISEFKEVSGIAFPTASNITNLARTNYFYRIAKTDTTYRYIANDAPDSVLGTYLAYSVFRKVPLSALTYFKSLRDKGKTSGATDVYNSYILSNWSDSYSFATPNNWGTFWFDENTDSASAEVCYCDTSAINSPYKFALHPVATGSSVDGLYVFSENTHQFTATSGTAVEEMSYFRRVNLDTVNDYIVINQNNIASFEDTALGEIYPSVNTEIVSGETSYVSGFFVKANLTIDKATVPLTVDTLYKVYNKSNIMYSFGTPGGYSNPTLYASSMENLYFGVSFTTSYLNAYLIPVWYRPRFLYKIVDKAYYSKNEYHKKDFGTVAPWVDTAIDVNDLVNNPIETIGNMWTDIQDNTSLTIRQADLYTLSEGDIVSFKAKASSDTLVDWPVFTNDETKIDLDKFDVTFIKSNGTDGELDKITIEDCDWRGYSSLLVNASTVGQSLLSNQTITINPQLDDDNDATTNSTTIEGGESIVFQLQNAVSNTSGDYIDVTTYDVSGNEISNTLYQYKALVSSNEVGNEYAYTSSDELYLYFTKDNASNPAPTQLNITIPANFRVGKYIIPMIGSELGTEIKCYVTRNYDYIESGTVIKYWDITSELENDSESTATSRPHIKLSTTNSRNYLSSVVNADEVEFFGDKYHYIAYNNDEAYIKINSPSVVTSLLQKYPYELDWCYIENGVYVKITESMTDFMYIGNDLLVTPEETEGDPSAMGWYELNDSGSYYELTSDTTVQSGKTYKKERDLYITNVNTKLLDSRITFEYFANATENIILDKLFKYSNNEDIPSSVFNDVKEKVKELDYNDEYNYCFTPDNLDKIEDPLLATNFFNTNHFYNKYTLAQLDFTDIENTINFVR